MARRPGPSLRALLFGCGAGAVLGQTASFLVGSENDVRHWGPWPAGPVHPSGPCCLAVAQAPFWVRQLRSKKQEAITSNKRQEARNKKPGSNKKKKKTKKTKKKKKKSANNPRYCRWNLSQYACAATSHTIDPKAAKAWHQTALILQPSKIGSPLII